MTQPDGPRMADGKKLLELVAQLSPETRARIARGMDDRFHEVTGAPRNPDCCGTDTTAPGQTGSDA